MHRRFLTSQGVPFETTRIIYCQLRQNLFCTLEEQRAPREIFFLENAGGTYVDMKILFGIQNQQISDTKLVFCLSLN